RGQRAARGSSPTPGAGRNVGAAHDSSGHIGLTRGERAPSTGFDGPKPGRRGGIPRSAGVAREHGTERHVAETSADCFTGSAGRTLTRRPCPPDAPFRTLPKDVRAVPRRHGAPFPARAFRG